MVELLITNQQLIKQTINKNACELRIKFNAKNKRAFFKTNEMEKYKPISIERIENLIV